MVGVEVCANSIQSAIEAEKGGAIRVELCANMHDGGTTPAKSQIELTRKMISIALNVIIRPRGGDFLYDSIDFESMKRDIELCGDLNCNGVVFGILDANGRVDMVRNAELVMIAKKRGMSVTFHRAIDRTDDPRKALEDVISLGCDRILTSGGYSNAYDGRFVIKSLVEQASERITIMPGAGINENNAFEIIQCTKAKEIHGTFQSIISGKMKFKNCNLNEYSEYFYSISNSERIQKIVKSINF